MKVLLPTIRDPGQIGGITTHITMLARGLEETGHQVRLLYLGAATSALLRKTGVVWPAGALNRMRRGWGMMYAADARGRLIAAVTDHEMKRAAAVGEPWEVLNAQEVYSIPYLREVADRHGVPLILTLHGYALYESVSEGYSAASQAGLNFLMRSEMRALRLADAVVTVDTRLSEHARRLVPEKSGSVHTLMNFVDTTFFAPLSDPAEDARLRATLRASWDIPPGKIVLFCPRRLVKKNGVIYPSLALATMKQDDRQRFLLLHAGEGGEREEIERIIRDNSLADTVRLLGGQGPDTVRDLYRLADIVLVPSVHSENVEEATSLAALEAMASGRPLIAGNVGGLAEMLVDGETGLLVPVGPETLAAAMVRLASDPALGSRLAAGARTYVVGNHSHLAAASAYVGIYQAARELTVRQQAVGDESSQPVETLTDVPSEHTLAGDGSIMGGHRPRVSVLGFPLDVVSLEEAAQRIVKVAAIARENAGPVRTRAVVSFNPELVMMAEKDAIAAEALLEADLCCADGVGAVWAAARLGTFLPGRVAGIDLAERVLELAAERRLSVYFLGGAVGVAEEAARRRVEALPGLRIAGVFHGYFPRTEEEEVVRAVRESQVDILLVAMGAPRQEVFVYRNRDKLGAAVAIGVGGAFDVWSGRVARAPGWARRAGVEWLYRLAADPRRLRRQLVLPQFAAKVFLGSADDYGPPKRGSHRNHRSSTS